MAKNEANEIIKRLRQVLHVGDKSSDGKLLGKFIDRGDETAFEDMVRRHGKMVLSVCRRVLANAHDAEDAFQSVFLVLVRKAKSVVPREMLGNWLYGVALQTAIRVKSMNAKKGRERQVAVMPEPKAADPSGRDDATDLLDQELSRLPDKYRVVIVLCELEGRTRKDVAEQLGWPEGSVSGRLARGKAMLAKRLARRGAMLSGEAVAVLLAQNAASASVPPALVSATVEAAASLAIGQTAAISAKITAITQGVLTSMLLTKLKTAAVVSCLCFLGLGVGAQFLAGQTDEVKKPLPIEQKAEGVEKAPNAAPGNIPGLYTVSLYIVDLVPTKGADGKIGPGKKEFDENEFTGFRSSPAPLVKVPGKKGLQLADSTPDLYKALEKLVSQSLALDIRQLQFTAIANQPAEFHQSEFKRLVSFASKFPDGRVSSGVNSKRLGTRANATVRIADDKSLSLELHFNESRLYPPDIGVVVRGKGDELYAHGMRPNFDVGNPLVKDDKLGTEFQVYDIVHHKLDTTFKVLIGKPIVASGFQAKIDSKEARPVGKNQEKLVPVSVPCDSQIVLFVSVENLVVRGKAGQ